MGKNCQIDTITSCYNFILPPFKVGHLKGLVNEGAKGALCPLARFLRRLCFS